MPNHEMHEFIGIGVWVFFLAYLFIGQGMTVENVSYIGIVGFAFCLLASVFPDVDQTSSRMFKSTRFLIAVLTFVIAFGALTPRFGYDTVEHAAYLFGISGLITLGVIALFYAFRPKHRGVTHTFRAAGVFAIASLILSYLFLYDFWTCLILAGFTFLSYAGHLALDGEFKL